MINLFINYYTDKSEQRQKEIEECLKRNIGNEQIDNIFIVKNRRPTFIDFFDMVNKVSGDTDISIIANSDIYFDDLKPVKHNLKEKECYALSRWDVMADGTAVHFNRRDSYDCYIFLGKVENVEDCDFTLGVAGNDNSIAERLDRAGYMVKNPSIDVKTYHLHNSRVRNYDPYKPTPKPYLLITPHTIEESNIVKAFIQ